MEMIRNELKKQCKGDSVVIAGEEGFLDSTLYF